MTRTIYSTFVSMLLLVALSACGRGSPALQSIATNITSSGSPNNSSSGSGGTSTTIPPHVVISSGNAQVAWDASLESAVNAAGGGYRVFYNTSDFTNATGISFVDVAYTQTSTTLTGLADGHYYVRVSAFSTLPDENGVSPSYSALSDAIEFEVAR